MSGDDNNPILVPDPMKGEVADFYFSVFSRVCTITGTCPMKGQQLEKILQTCFCIVRIKS